MSKSIYYNGKIYENVENIKPTINPYPQDTWDNLFHNISGIPIIHGTHNFKDGEDVTGRYELKYQYKGFHDWITCDKDNYDISAEPRRRIIAVPLPLSTEPAVKTKTPEEMLRKHLGKYFYVSTKDESVQFMINAMEEYHNQFVAVPAPAVSGNCKCNNEIKTGQTSIMCCNVCGLPDEQWWQVPANESNWTHNNRVVPPVECKSAEPNKCSFDNVELVKKVREWVRKLAMSGGKDWTLEVPVNFDKDPDVLIEELCKRFERMEAYKAQPTPVPQSAIDILFKHWKAWSGRTFTEDDVMIEEMKDTDMAKVCIPAMIEYKAAASPVEQDADDGWVYCPNCGRVKSPDQ